MAETVSSPKFTVQEMWRMFTRTNDCWGVQGYDVAKQHFDHQRHAKEAELFSYSEGKTKRPKQGDIKKDAKRGDFLEGIIRCTSALPAPWNYEIAGKIAKYPGRPQSVPRSGQAMNFKWKNVPDEQRVYEDPVKFKRPPLNLSLKKETYIDNIIRDNTRENYPQPSPASYFMDSKSIKKFAKGHEELVTPFEKKHGTKSIFP